MDELVPTLDIGLASALRAPLQGRSRESYERMLSAAEELLAERGDGGFTLSEVSRVGKVSIGSIYNRFESKDALLHAVQLRVLERVNREMGESMASGLAGEASLDSLVTRLVEAVAETLRRHAPPMAALMQIASVDDHVAATGKAFYQQTVDAWSAAILAHRDEIRRPDAERAVDTAFRVLYAAVARYLGFGSARGSSLGGNWDVLKQDIAVMIAAFLRAG